MTDAFEVLRPAHEQAVPILVHVPHASTRIPAEVREEILLDDGELDRELRLITDHATDVLSEGAGEVGATRFVNRLSRLVIDPERFSDGSEPMEAVGMGPVYLRTTQGAALRDLDDRRREAMLQRWFQPYAYALAVTTRELRGRFGSCTIIDLHSYPSQVLPYELEPTTPRPQVCIGTDGFHTSDRIINDVVEACEKWDLNWELNVPFAGTYVPSEFYGSDERVSSVMLEIRRDTYLDEAAAEPTSSLEHIKAFVTEVAARLDLAANSFDG